VTNDGIEPLLRKQDWELLAQLVRVSDTSAQFRLLAVTQGEGFTVGATMRLTFDDKAKSGAGWSEAELWKALAGVSKVRSLRLSKDNMLQLDDVRVRLTNAGGRLTVKQTGGLFENV
jgi:hypothetical protein